MRVVATIGLIIFSLTSFGQQKQVAKADSLLSRLDTLKLPNLQLRQADTLKLEAIKKLDSLKQIKNRTKNKLDSINPINSLQRQQEKLESAKTSLLSKANGLDTLEAKEKLARYNKKLDSTRTHLQSRIDSLSHVKLDLNSIKRLDSLKLRLDSLKNKGPLGDLKEAEVKLAGLQQKVGNKVTDAQKQINEKLGVLSQGGLDAPSLNLPGLEVGKLNLPDVNKPTLPTSLNLNTTDLKLPAANLPTGDLSLNPELNLKNPGEKANMGGLPDPKTNRIKGLDGLKDLQDDFAKVGEVSTEIKGYQNDIKKVQEGGMDELEQLPEKAEEKALELAGNEFEQHAAMIEKWKENPAYAKELALNEAKEQAVNHFAGKEEELKAAMEQLSKLKSKKKYAEGVLDLFKKKQRSLKGVPFIERLVPGTTLQVQVTDNFWLDVNPYLGYRISGRLTAGMGWNERISFNYRVLDFARAERIYGPRLYGEFKLRENFVVKAETEWMNAKVLTPYQAYLKEGPTREWVWSTFAGVKNVFVLSKGLRGNVQVLYNLYDPEKKSPYTSRLNLRFGFEYRLLSRQN